MLFLYYNNVVRLYFAKQNEEKTHYLENILQLEVMRFTIFFNNVQLAQALEAYTKNIFQSIMDKIFEWYLVIINYQININIKVERTILRHR